MQQNFKQVKTCDVCKWKKFKFSVYELLKFCHISKMNTQYYVAHEATITLLWLMPPLYTHTHMHINTHTFNICKFQEKSRN